MNRRTKATLAGTVGIALSASTLTGLPGASGATTVPQAIGLTSDHRLASFSVTTPERLRLLPRITRLSGDTWIVGIDYRVQDGRLYGVGNSGGVYLLSTAGSRATKVSQLTVALSGTRFGVDFNPAADRLRVISDTGQNLRHDVNAGGVTIADGTLTHPPLTTAAVGVSGAGYTNNDLSDATGTTLVDLDTAADQVALQAPANSGQLSATGKLGVDTGPAAGLDVYSDLARGVTVSNQGFAVLNVGRRAGFYRVSPLTGDATLEGRFPSSARVRDIAVKLDSGR